jgi:hypothetical protein
LVADRATRQAFHARLQPAVGSVESNWIMNLVVVGRHAEEELMLRQGARRAARSAVDDVCRRIERICPEGRRSCTVN